MSAALTVRDPEASLARYRGELRFAVDRVQERFGALVIERLDSEWRVALDPAGGDEILVDVQADAEVDGRWRRTGLMTREWEVWGHMAGQSGKRNLGPGHREEMLATLRARFEGNMGRHRDLQWAAVRSRLEADPEKLWSLSEMERTGGEPDIVGQDEMTGEYIFCDCSAESPEGRRSVCYDGEALEARKKHKPENSAVAMATATGAVLLTEEEYRGLQDLGAFDTRTSSWLLTPPDIRGRGGAIFGDFRFGRVFVYHNGAESYYAARGFRCSLRV